MDSKDSILKIFWLVKKMQRSKTRFMYLDTWVLGELCDNPKSMYAVSKYLKQRNLTVPISSAHASELSKAKHLHSSLIALMKSLPMALIKPHETILDEEVRGYPNRRLDTLLLYTLDNVSKRTIANWLDSDELALERLKHNQYARRMKNQLEKLKPNFPPSNSGKYSDDQTELFSNLITIQWLKNKHANFLAPFKDKVSDIIFNVFQSVQIIGYVIFYKYYIENQQPKISDLGDLMHLASLPYCEWAIVDKEMGRILNIIKSKHDLFKEVNIRSGRYLKEVLRSEY